MQTEETRAEAKYLCQVKYNTISPKNSNSVIGLVQGGLLAAYLISQRSTFVTRDEFMNLLMCFKERELPQLPPPTILVPVELWTGKQVITAILPDINVYPDSFNMDKTDETLVIINGEFLSGNLMKKNIGPQTNSIIHLIRNDKGVDASAQFLDTLKFTLNEWLKNQGFSVGIGDAYMEDKDKTIEQQLQNKKEEVSKSVEQFISTHGHLSSSQLESGINDTLNRVVGDVGQIVLKHIKRTNRLMHMVIGGSKGNETNIAQIIGMLGGQNVSGKRIGFGFHRRTLPYFNYNDHGASSRGFVFNSYKSGLSPQEYYFHAMGGREGLVDTAIKTGEVGYISRKLMKAMEDLGVQYDNTVRNSQGDIVQLLYGEDGVDPCSLELQTIPTIKMDYMEFVDQYRYTPEELEQYSLAYPELKLFLPREFEQLENDRAFIIKMHTMANGMYMSSHIGQFYLPVNIDRVMKDALQRFDHHYYHIINEFSDKAQFEKSKTPESLGKNIVHPMYVLKEMDRFETRLEKIRGLYTMHSQPTCVKLLVMAVRSKMSCKLITHRYGLSSQAVDWIFNRLCDIYTKHLAEPGEMTGAIAAQSIGEPTQQMTLNSVDWTEKIIVRKTNQDVFIGEIGKFIDELIEENPNTLQKLPEERDYLDIRHLGYTVATVDENGKMSWELLEAVTRHLPGGHLIKAKTRCGRTVKGTQADSFLVLSNNKIVSKRGDQLEVGDSIPVVYKMPQLDSLNYITVDGYDCMLDEQFGYSCAANALLTSQIPLWMFIANIKCVRGFLKKIFANNLIESESKHFINGIAFLLARKLLFV